MRVSHLRSQDAKAASYRLVYFLFLSMSILKKKKSLMIVSNPFFAVGILHQGSYLIQISKLAFILLSTLRQNFKEKRTFQSANMMFGCEEQVQSSLCHPVFHVCFSALCSFNTRLFPYFAKKFSRLWKSPGSHGMHSPQQLIYKPDENGKHWSQQHLYFSLALLLLDSNV